MELIGEMPKVEEIKRLLPLNKENKTKRNKLLKELKDILDGNDNRLLIIIGPCSCDRPASMVEYLSKLSKIKESLSDKLLIIPRIFTSKPRSLGVGYMGLIEKPDPREKADLNRGIVEARKIHRIALDEFSMPGADEMLYPDNYAYLDDILVYISLGARSVESQAHRKLSSGLDIPVGMKNPTDGNLHSLINSIYAARNEQYLSYRGKIYKTKGNPYAHAILRGYVNYQDRNVANFDKKSILKFKEMALELSMAVPPIIIDCNHSNSNKNCLLQESVIDQVMGYRQDDAEMKKIIRGFMIESYLKEGKQEEDGISEGLSITDPCLGWKKSEKLLLKLASY